MTSALSPARGHGSTRDRVKLEQDLEDAVAQCREYESVIDRLKQREAALMHRLVLAEVSGSEAAIQLGVSIHQDAIRELNALEELQNKVLEMEALEYRKADTLRNIAKGLRVDNDRLRAAFMQEIGDLRATIQTSVNDLVQTLTDDLRSSLEITKEAIQQDLRNEKDQSTKIVREELTAQMQRQEDRTVALLESLAKANDMYIEMDLFKKALHFIGDDDTREAVEMRFLNSCSIPKIIALERALEESQDAEARAKRIAIRIAQKRDQEVEAEKAKVEKLSIRLDSAIAALEKARTDFDSVSVVVDELNRHKSRT